MLGLKILLKIRPLNFKILTNLFVLFCLKRQNFEHLLNKAIKGLKSS